MMKVVRTGLKRFEKGSFLIISVRPGVPRLKGKRLSLIHFFLEIRNSLLV